VYYLSIPLAFFKKGHKKRNDKQEYQNHLPVQYKELVDIHFKLVSSRFYASNKVDVLRIKKPAVGLFLKYDKDDKNEDWNVKNEQSK
jgi:hypothetical protein